MVACGWTSRASCRRRNGGGGARVGVSEKNIEQAPVQLKQEEETRYRAQLAQNTVL